MDPIALVCPPPSWERAPDALLDAARAALAADRPPPPLLLAYAGRDPQAIAVLRPFGPGELPDALIELLALLLPLGTDRIAMTMPARAWSIADPIVPVTDDADLRARVVLLTTADAHGVPCRSSTTLHPYDTGAGLGDPVTFDEPPESPALQAMTVLLDARRDLQAGGPDLRVAAQLARVLLLGHEVLLAPDAAARLELATTS